MPDASSDAMTAFISWMLIVTFLGEGSFGLAVALIPCNLPLDIQVNTLRSIIACVLLSVAMCSKFLFSHWLIDHRQNHHPLKTVYRVPKFAKQHKCPVNRSAFTYCEDEVPSRVDLGKTKYGGPFTTEEVEDVKTFFRIIAVLSVIFTFIVVVLPLLVAIPLDIDPPTTIMYSVNDFFTAAVFLLYEYIVYPCIKIRYRLSMLKRIGACMLFGVLSSVILFVLSVVTEVGSVDLSSIIIKEHHAFEIIWHWLTYIVTFIFFSSLLQFLYSQSPEQMKGMFLVWTWFTVPIVSILLNGKRIKFRACSQLKYCGVYLTSVAVAFSLLVFAVYCCVARWYKRRERDEPCDERARIEEIYGRYVEHNSIEEQDSD